MAFEASSRNTRKEKKQRTKFWTIYIFSNKHATTTKTNCIGRQIKTLKRESNTF